MPDNPFAKYAAPEGENPFAKYASPTPAPSEGEGATFFSEAGRAIVGGTTDAVNETSNLLSDAGQWLNENVADLGSISVGSDGIGHQPGVPQTNPLQVPDLVADPLTPAGDIAKSITQFTVGMVGAGKLLKGLGWAQQVTRGGQIARATVQGGIADASVFDPFENRLSNLIQEVPVLSNPLNEALAASPDDTSWEGRLKNVVEGAGLGIAVDGLISGVRALRGYRAAKAAGNVQEYLEKDGFEATGDFPFNPEKMVLTPEERAAVTAANDAAEVELKAMAEVEPLSVTAERAAKEVADLLEMPEDVVVGRFVGKARDVQGLAHDLLSMKQLVATRAAHAQTIAKQAINASPEVQAEVATRLRAFNAEVGATKGVQSEAARATSAGRIPVERMEAPGGLDDASLIRHFAFAPDVKSVVKLASGHTKMEWLLQYRVNALLSSPKTHLVNVVSNAVMALSAPVERAIGSIGNRGEQIEAAGHAVGLILNSWEALRAGIRSGVAGRAFLDPDHITNEMASQLAGEGGRSIGSTLWSTMGWPGRLLTAEDEAFKTLNYRAVAYGRRLRESLENGMSLREASRDAVARVDDMLKDGRAPAGWERDFARELTFTNPLAQGTYGKTLQNAVNGHNSAKLVFPFVRTPVNILRQTWFRTPGLNLASKQFRADWHSTDPVRRSLARGRMATGLALYGGALMAAVNGDITGGAPVNAGQRDVWYAAGNRPYSIKVGDTWVSYQRLEPFSTPLAIVADLVRNAEAMDAGDVDEVVGGILVSFITSVSDKTFLQGMFEIVDAVAHPDRSLARFAGNMAASFIPSGAQPLAGLVGEDDRDFRNTRASGPWGDLKTIGYSVMNRLPWFSETLPPRRSWITGEILHRPEDMMLPERLTPVPVVGDDGDEVARRLVHLGFEAHPPTRKVGDVELDAWQYDRLLQLTGAEVYPRLHARVMSEGFMRLPSDVQETLLGRDVNRAKEVARIKLKGEDLGLQDSLREAQRVVRLGR